jgi:hypothetical protein
MSGGRTATGAARVGSGAGRLIRAWRVMAPERRLAVYAALGLFLTLFLPWYQRQFFVVIGGKLAPASDSQTAWGAFSFVEAAVLLVAAGVLTLLFQRAEGKAFHLPGGDGFVIMVAGFWTCALVIWRIFDKQGGQTHAQNATTYGIEWGIFVALAVAALLAYAGSRIRAAHQPEPPLPGEEDPPQDGWGTPPDRGSAATADRTQPAARYERERPAARYEREQPAARYEREQPAARYEREQPASAPSSAPPPRRRRPPILDEPRPSASDGRRRPEAPRAPAGGDPASPRERRVGWLTEPPSHAADGEDAPAPAAEWPAPEWRPPSAERPSRPPKPVPADEAATIRATRNPSPLPPSTPAARRRRQLADDDDVTTPFEHED